MCFLAVGFINTIQEAPKSKWFPHSSSSFSMKDRCSK